MGVGMYHRIVWEILCSRVIIHYNYYINSDSIYTKYILGGYGIYAIAFVEIDTQVEVWGMCVSGWLYN